MKRPMLVAGVTVAVTSALLLYFEEAAYVCAVILAASVLILFSIKPLKLRKFIFLPVIAAGVLLMCAVCFLFNGLKLAPALKLTENNAEIYGKVTQITESYYDGCLSVTLKCDTVNGEKQNTNITVTVPAKSAPELYDYCKLTDAELTFNTNKGAIAENGYLTADCESFEVLWQSDRDIFYYCAAFKQAVTERLGEYLGGDYFGLVRGMLFGETESISAKALQSFRASGVSHLLAVSGLHTSLWCGLLLSLLTLLKIPGKLHGIFCGVFLILFCAVASFTPSVLRASLMTALAVAAPLFRRKADALNSLGFAVTVLVLNNPYTVFSVSFLLSVSATLGVILAKPAEEKIYELNKKIPQLRLRRLVNYISTTVCVSAYAAVFTLPFSAYFFRTFSIVSPLTNVLAVKLAFYALIISVIALAVSCIPFYAVQTAAIFLFKICKSLLYSVISVTGFFGGFKFSTLPVQKDIFLPALAVCSVLIIAGIAVKKLRKKSGFLKITSAASAAVLAFSLIIPMFSDTCGTVLTVIPDGDNVFAVLKCGTEYAVFCGSKTVKPSLCRDFLPVCNSEKLTTVYSNDVADISSLEYFSEYFKPESVVVTPFAAQKLTSKGNESGVLVKSGSHFTLNNKISIKTVDTYRMRCVIMEKGEKRIILSLHADNDIKKIIQKYGDADILIMNGSDYIKDKTLTCVLCCKAKQALSKEVHEASRYYKDFCTTAERGTVTFHF